MPVPYGSQSPLQTVNALFGHYGMLPNSGASLASVAWPVANLVVYLPCRNPIPMTVTKLWWENGGSVGGNVQAGLYDADGLILINTGTVAQATASTLQVVDTTDVYVPAGRFYFGLTMSGTTGQMIGAVPSISIAAALGVLTETTASFGLPTVMTPVTPSNGYVSSCGFYASPRTVN